MFERRIFLADLFNQLNNKFLNNSLFEKFDIPLNDNSDKNKKDDFNTEIFKTDDGRIIISSFVRTSGFDDDMLTTMFGSKETSNTEITTLEKQLQNAISKEDYELAISLRDKINKTKNAQAEINTLEAELKKVISEHNFERAIEIRDELKKLKM
jgi:excinuclease UvrABC helicase subunit UvrB